MDMAAWLVVGGLVAFVVLAVVATRKRWIGNADRLEDHARESALRDVSRYRGGSGSSF